MTSNALLRTSEKIAEWLAMTWCNPQQDWSNQSSRGDRKNWLKKIDIDNTTQYTENSPHPEWLVVIPGLPAYAGTTSIWKNGSTATPFPCYAAIHYVEHPSSQFRTLLTTLAASLCTSESIFICTTTPSLPQIPSPLPPTTLTAHPCTPESIFICPITPGQRRIPSPLPPHCRGTTTTCVSLRDVNQNHLTKMAAKLRRRTTKQLKESRLFTRRPR